MNNKLENTPPCPECDKMLAVKDKSQALADFLEWLEETKGYTLCQWNEGAPQIGIDGRFDATFISRENLLAEYFGIDLRIVEKEKRALLSYLSNYNLNGSVK